MSLLNFHLHQQTTVFSPLTTTSSIPLSKTHHRTLKFFRRATTSSLPFSLQHHPQQPLYTNAAAADGEDYEEEEEEEQVIGDCLVFEEGVFEDPYLQQNFEIEDTSVEEPLKRVNNRKKNKVEIKPENLIPEGWQEAVAELNVTRKERRKLAQEMEFGRSLEKRKQGLRPIPMDYSSPREYEAAKLRELRPLVLDNAKSPVEEVENEGSEGGVDEGESGSGRVAPRNPKMAVYGRSLEDISRFFNSGIYDPEGTKDPKGSRKLFTKEEKALMNMRVPDLASATSGKWQPLHTLAASGDFYLVDTLLKYSEDINVSDKDGLTAIHKAILGKKIAICNYLLRNSANPFVRDEDGATLMHYAVLTASTQLIKILLLYNVDINLQDNDGWTPLHLAVQSRRTDVVKLLLIKGADKTLKNQNGLTPLDICLHGGRDMRTYELIRLLKQLPKPRKHILPYTNSLTQ